MKKLEQNISNDYAKTYENGNTVLVAGLAARTGGIKVF